VDVKDLLLQLRFIGSGDGGVGHGGEGILPDEALLGHFWAEVAGDGTHIAVEKLDCCFPKSVKMSEARQEGLRG
jgi:hypothetical protein